MRTYAPWIWAAVFALLIVLARLLTNRILGEGLRPVPRWASAIYMIGFTGLLGTFFWSISAIAWWACLPVAGIYGLTCLVPSVVQRLAREPRVAHLKAIQQAIQELDSLQQAKPRRER